jgi:choline kinase
MSRRINLIPMAGEGQRFKDVGYKIPKPLIEINNQKMICRAADCLPSTDKNIFICRKNHIDEASIDQKLKQHYKNAEIVVVDYLTEGQACTCLLATEHLQDDDILTIGACDNAMVYDEDKFEKILAGNADVIVWTFRNNPAVLQNPKMYGWVKTEKEQVTGVSVKIPISDSPMKDHAVIGAFTFKRAIDFIRESERMIAANSRVNGEFYVDEMINFCVEAGLNVKVFEVDSYICWGTPQDLDIYNYWSKYFQKSGF